MSIDYNQKIPNNVNLSENKTLQRASSTGNRSSSNWWQDMGPDDSQNFDVYLRTAVSVDPAAGLTSITSRCPTIAGESFSIRPKRIAR